MEFATWRLSIGPYLKYCLICSDEAYFYLTLSANKQNNCNWCDYRPLEGIERRLHDEKIKKIRVKVYNTNCWDCNTKKNHLHTNGGITQNN